MFVWNEYLTHAIWNRLKNPLWTVALVHGFFKQVLADQATSISSMLDEAEMVLKNS